MYTYVYIHITCTHNKCMHVYVIHMYIYITYTYIYNKLTIIYWQYIINACIINFIIIHKPKFISQALSLIYLQAFNDHLPCFRNCSILIAEWFVNQCFFKATFKIEKISIYEGL